MVAYDFQNATLVGNAGSLPVLPNDEAVLKLAMLMEGECEGLGASRAAEKFGMTRQRYSQIRAAYLQHGAEAFISKRRGPKSNYRRTDEVTRQIIRHRFLDPDASAKVISQKLRQTNFPVSTRSVERVLAEYGLQKKSSTPAVPGMKVQRTT